jgi:hypothetical protein
MVSSVNNLFVSVKLLNWCRNKAKFVAANRHFPHADSPRKMRGRITSMATELQTLSGQPAAAGLTNEEILRYSRHLIMPEVGMEGQLKLKTARVLLIGTGGLGAPLGL